MKKTIMVFAAIALIASGILGIPTLDQPIHAESIQLGNKEIKQEEHLLPNIKLAADLPKSKKQLSKKKKDFNILKPKTLKNQEKQKQTTTKEMVVEATAYTASCEGCSGITRTGINLLKNPNLKVIAVDPRVIPLGSRVYVEGYGTAIAGDTGGDIQGNRIDLFIPNRSDALAFGRKQLTIKILS